MDKYLAVKALFLGPKAENADLFEKLLVECFRDHCFWRRNFRPEDIELISETDRLQSPFLESAAALRQHLNQLVAQLKRGSPTYHPRYLGHMQTDLAMAGIIGQLATIFYSQNNVTPAASPVTSRLEQEVIEWIIAMVGYKSDSKSGEPIACGHLCSGGTAANIEAIWAARNVRHMPISLFLNLRRALSDPTIPAQQREALQNLTVHYRGQARVFLDLKTFELLNLSIDRVLELRDQLVDLFMQTPGKAHGDRSLTSRQAEVQAERFLRSLTPEEIGIPRVNSLLQEAEQWPLSDYPWVIYLSTTKHYSFEKIADLLGLGRQALRQVPIDRNFGLDVSQLRTALNDDVRLPLAGRQPCPLPLAVVAILGSTEEGAVDDLPALLRLRDDLRNEGIEFWLHADAAYGGYAASTLRARFQTRRPSPRLHSLRSF